MYAGIAQVLVQLVPGATLGVWVVTLTVLTQLVLLGRSYRYLQSASIVMVVASYGASGRGAEYA